MAAHRLGIWFLADDLAWPAQPSVLLQASTTFSSLIIMPTGDRHTYWLPATTFYLLPCEGRYLDTG